MCLAGDESGTAHLHNLKLIQCDLTQFLDTDYNSLCTVADSQSTMGASNVDEEQVTIQRVTVDENDREKEPLWHTQSSSFVKVSTKGGYRDDRDYQTHPEEERRLVRKIDRRLLPVLTVMYTLNYLDRTNIVCQHPLSHE